MPDADEIRKLPIDISFGRLGGKILLDSNVYAAVFD